MPDQILTTEPHARATVLLRRGLFAAWLLSMPVLALLYLRIEPSPDQSQFDYMGWMATQGLPYYAGSFDMNWPGGLLLHETAIRLFGPQPWSWHMLDFLLMQVTAIAAALFLWRAGFRLAPLIALLLYPPIYVTAGGWMAGQRDIVATGMLIWALCAMLAPRRMELPAMVIAGVIVGFAVLIRPTYLSVLVGLILLELAPRGWIGQERTRSALARAGALLTGFLLVVQATIATGLIVGNLDDWYEQSVRFTASVYVDKPPMALLGTLNVLFLQWWHWLSLCGLIGFALWLRHDGRLAYPLMLLIGLAAAIMLSFVAQRKGFGYHVAGFLTLLVMLTAVAIDQARSTARVATRPWTRAAATVTMIGLVLLTLAGTWVKLADYGPLVADLGKGGLDPVAGTYDIPAAEQTRLIEIVRNGSGPEDRMVQYGTAYQIPYLARRLPAYRFITPAVELMTPDFPPYHQWMTEIESGLREHRPKFVLITGHPFERRDGVLVPLETGKPVLAALLAHLSTGYAVAMTGTFGTLFERVGE